MSVLRLTLTLEYNIIFSVTSTEIWRWLKSCSNQAIKLFKKKIWQQTASVTNDNHIHKSIRPQLFCIARFDSILLVSHQVHQLFNISRLVLEAKTKQNLKKITPILSSTLFWNFLCNTGLKMSDTKEDAGKNKFTVAHMKNSLATVLENVNNNNYVKVDLIKNSSYVGFMHSVDPITIR